MNKHHRPWAHSRPSASPPRPPGHFYRSPNILPTPETILIEPPLAGPSKWQPPLRTSVPPSSPCHPNTNCLARLLELGLSGPANRGPHQPTPDCSGCPTSPQQSTAHVTQTSSTALCMTSSPSPLQPISHLWGHPISNPGPLAVSERRPLPTGSNTRECTHTHTHWQVLASLSQPVSFPIAPPKSWSC